MLTAEIRALAPTLRKSAYLKLAQQSWGRSTVNALKAVPAAAAPSALAMTATGLGGGTTDEVIGAGALAAAARPVLNAGVKGLRSRATRIGDEATALKQHHTGVQQTTTEQVPLAKTSPPVSRVDISDPKADLSSLDPTLRTRIEAWRTDQAQGPRPFDPAALPPDLQKAYGGHTAAEAAAEAALKARAPFAFNFGEKAPRPVRVAPSPADPMYPGALTGYRNARAEDVRTIEGLANANALSPDDYLQHVSAAAKLRQGDPGRQAFDDFEKSLKAVNTRFNTSPAPAESLLDRAQQPFSSWQNRVASADTDFANAAQARELRDQAEHTAYATRRSTAEAAERQKYDQDPVVAAAQKAKADRAAFEAANVPQGKTPQEIAAARATLDVELNKLHADRVTAATAADASSRMQERQGIRDVVAARIEEPRAAFEAGNAAKDADRASRVARGAGYVAPVAAAGLGTLGAPPAGAATGSGREAAGNLADRVGVALKGAPKPDYLQIAKDYLPVVAGVGAVGALALWLLSRDDEEEEKTAAAPDEDRVAAAARNRRRIESLLARNPRALDNLR
jgi:hypothetical protein